MSAPALAPAGHDLVDGSTPQAVPAGVIGSRPVLPTVVPPGPFGVWMRIRDGLPAPYRRVLVYGWRIHVRGAHVAELHAGEESIWPFKDTFISDGFVVREVTHWMPMPGDPVDMPEGGAL